MKHLLPILFLSFMFSGELEVDGDLTVTGNIQNQTIDSLLQVIADLQAQINAMQLSGGSLTTKLITIENISTEDFTDYFYEIDFDEIFGSELTYAIVDVIDINLLSFDGGSQFDVVVGSYQENVGLTISNNGIWYYTGSGFNSTVYLNTNYPDYSNPFGNKNLYLFSTNDISFDLTLAVTAQFSN